MTLFRTIRFHHFWILPLLLPANSFGLSLAPTDSVSKIIAHYESGAPLVLDPQAAQEEHANSETDTADTSIADTSVEEASPELTQNSDEVISDRESNGKAITESQNTESTSAEIQHNIPKNKAQKVSELPSPYSEQLLARLPISPGPSLLSKYSAAQSHKTQSLKAESKKAEQKVLPNTTAIAKPVSLKKAVTAAPIVKPLTANIASKREPLNFPSELAKQRYHYDNARKALGNKNDDEFNYHYAQLGDYPLVPYLDYATLKQEIYDFDLAKIDAFLEEHEGTFLAYRLREQALYAFSNRGRWNDFLAYYREDMGQRALQCQAIYARFKTGDKKALEGVADIWTQGKSQPKACDRLFSAWRQKGGLTDEIAWTRFNNAMQNRKTSLARYVRRYMSAETKALADKYLEVHGYPGRIKKQRNYMAESAENTLQMQQIISHGIKRFARIDALGALKQWERYEAAQLFPKEIAVETKVELLKRLTIKGHTAEAEALMQQSTDIRNNDVVERLIRESLRQEQYAKVLHWVDYLDEEAKNSGRWQYWRARAQDEVARAGGDVPSDATPSHVIYEQLADERSFYGFMAADILKRNYALEDRPSFVANHTEHVVRNLPAIKRAYELWVRGSQGESRAEWQFATKQMNKTQLAAAGRIAREWGWYNKGIHAMIRGDFWDDLNIRFPLAYRDAVEAESSNTDVDTTFIYAIARQESAFHEKAKSSAGAMGLMQLMPYTARQTAKKSGIKHRDSYLLDPEYNIKLGSRYLKEQLEKFNGNRIFAAAAYNAGPHRVNKWIKKNSLSLPYDVWIESIPFRETRGYVQNVLAFSVIYAYRLGQEGELVTKNEINLQL